MNFPPPSLPKTNKILSHQAYWQHTPHREDELGLPEATHMISDLLVSVIGLQNEILRHFPRAFPLIPKRDKMTDPPNFLKH